MDFVSVYTVPAFKNSMGIFQEDNCYFFSNYGDGKYNISKIVKSTYLGLGFPYSASEELPGGEHGEGKGYVSLRYIGKILSIMEFDISLKGDNVSFSDAKVILGDGELSDSDKRAFKKQVDNFHRYYNGKINTTIPPNIILIKTEEPILIDEGLLYPKREIITFPFSIDGNGEYLKLDNFLDKITISKDTVLSTKSGYFEINGEYIEIDSIHRKVYTFILKKLFTSDNMSFSLNDFEEELKNLTNRKSINAGYYKDSIVRSFNDASFSQKLDFNLHFSLSKKLNKDDVEEKINVIYTKKKSK